jgi:Flp pilus assembly pilin Flp
MPSLVIAVYALALSALSRLRTRIGHQAYGATAAEYSLMVVFIAAVIAGTVVVLGVKVDGLFARGLLP